MPQKRRAEKASSHKTAVSRKSSVRFTNVWDTSNVGKAHTRRVAGPRCPDPARPVPHALPSCAGPRTPGPDEEDAHWDRGRG